jgi:hypothetical protein
VTRPILYISGPYSAGNGRTVADNIAVALIRFAEAYREWCREQYGDEEVGA